MIHLGNRLRSFAAILVASSLIFAAGCGLDDDDEYGEEEGAESSVVVSGGGEGAPTEFVTIQDPVENCFSIDVPKGWTSQAYLSRAWDLHREVTTSISPQDDTVIFLGDPSSNQYWAPKAMNPALAFAVKNNPYQKVSEFIPADQYFEGYVQKKFGKLDSFAIQSIEPNPEVDANHAKKIKEIGLPVRDYSTVDVKFTYQENGEKISAVIIGTTFDYDNFWIVSVAGISTEGDPETYRPTLMAMAASYKTNPEWQAKQQALQEQRMAQMRQQHANNMDWIQQSAKRHQARMEAIWARNDASMNAYWQRSAASDVSHRRFLNYINDESTVVGSDGKQRQVDNSYQRYFVNKDTGKYVGGDAHFDSDSLRKMGLNPDDYEEMKVRP